LRRPTLSWLRCRMLPSSRSLKSKRKTHDDGKLHEASWGLAAEENAGSRDCCLQKRVGRACKHF
jgi:hypothetical protein